MPLRLLANTTNSVTQADLDAVMQMAQQGLAAGQNARGMVLARDPQLASLREAADQLPITQQQAATEHAELRQMIAALQTRALTIKTKRVTTTQLLALGATTDLTATWDTPFPDTNYLVIPLLDAATGIANIQGPAYKTHTAATATVTIRANIAVAAGLAINIIGMRLG